MIVGLLLLFHRVLRRFAMLDTILTDLDIAPATAFFLDLLKHILRDNWLVVTFSSVSIDLTVIDFSFRLVFRRVGFEDNGGTIVFRIGKHEFQRML